MFVKIYHISILLLFLVSANTLDDNYVYKKLHYPKSDYNRPHDKGFVHNKRDTQQSSVNIENVNKGNQSEVASAKSSNQTKLLQTDEIENSKPKITPVGYSEGENNAKVGPVSLPTQTNLTKLSISKEKLNITKIAHPEVLVDNKNQTLNSTESKFLPASNTGVVKRGLIVFGAFGLLAIVYFIFYRRKSKNYESNNTHNSNDNNQFRYGVLQSDDRRDNLELSRIPLTMESDEEEDDDLEIFDLEQKKKSLSYVNLQTNDEDIVLHSSSKDESKNNLLLDIEDASSDTLINWSSNGSKSIL